MTTQTAMAKPVLIAYLADQANVDKKTATAVLDALGDVVTTAVTGGTAVILPGIGKFIARARLARMVRNPATRAQFEKPADRAVKVTIAKALKDALNG